MKLRATTISKECMLEVLTFSVPDRMHDNDRLLQTEEPIISEIDTTALIPMNLVTEQMPVQAQALEELPLA